MEKQRGHAVPAVARGWQVLSSLEQSFPLLALGCAQFRGVEDLAKQGEATLPSAGLVGDFGSGLWSLSLGSDPADICSCSVPAWFA